MLTKKQGSFYNLRELQGGAVIVLTILFLLFARYQVLLFVNSENQYVAKIHNQLLGVLAPFRKLSIVDSKIKKDENSLTFELKLKKASIVSEIDLSFSDQSSKDITVYFKSGDNWQKIIELPNNRLDDIKIQINPTQRIITSDIKIEFTNIKSGSSAIYLKDILLFKPLR